MYECFVASPFSRIIIFWLLKLTCAPSYTLSAPSKKASTFSDSSLITKISVSVRVKPSSGKAKPVVLIVIELEFVSTLLTVNSRPLMADLASALEFVKSPAILIFSFIEMLLVPLDPKFTVKVFSVELKTIVDAHYQRGSLAFCCHKH